MRSRAEHHKSKASDKPKRVAYGIVMVLAVLLFVTGLKIFSADTKNQNHPQKPLQLASAGAERRAETNNDLWDGPILYHQPNSEPIDLILIEKATQKLYLVQYDGNYRRVKSYACGTGEKRAKRSGKKT